MTAPARVTLKSWIWLPCSCLQSDLHGADGVVVAGDHQRPEVLVPGGQEGEDGQGGHGRAGQRHGHPGHEPPVAVAVEGGRLLEVLRDLQERLAEQEGAEPGGQEGTVRPWKVLYQPRAGDGVQVGDQGDLEGDHQGGQEDHEERPAEGEAEEGEGVGGQHRGHQLPVTMIAVWMAELRRYIAQVALVPGGGVGATTGDGTGRTSGGWRSSRVGVRSELTTVM